MKKDPFGAALQQKLSGAKSLSITVLSEYFEEDEIPVDYLFRSYEEMPKMEQLALNLTKGKVLDVGACAGSHSLWLQENGIEVDGIDISQGAIDVMKKRGVKTTICSSFLQLKDKKYDTILFLMNGIGIAGKLTRLASFFEQIKKLLNKNGQVLLDSSDLIYLYEEIDLNAPYHGEIEYQLLFEEHRSNKFDWLFIDFDLLQAYAEKSGFSCELVKKGAHYDFLARLTLVG